MFDCPETYQVGLSFYYRGPEWAVAVRQGDLEALEWVMKRCSQFWNGAGMLIVPVRADGRTWPVIADYLDRRPVEACYVHESVPPTAHKKLAGKLGTSTVRRWLPLRDGFDDAEMHPLLLQPRSDSTTRRLLRVPHFASKRLSRISLATWGHIDPDDLPHYRGYFNVGEVDEPPHAHVAMLNGQLQGTSPLEQSLSLISPYGSLPVGRSLFVFGKGSFQELVTFWNLRSRSRDIGNRPMLFGVARESLVDTQLLAALPSFLATDSLYAQTPDLGLISADRKLAEQALGELGFKADFGNTVKRSVGGGRGNRPLSFGFFGPHIPQRRFKRGARAAKQVTVVAGEITFRFPRPDGLPQTGHHVRLGVDGLPLPMPLTDEAAQSIYKNTYASTEGLTLSTHAWAGQSYVRFALPNAWESLEVWAAAQGETVELSPPGGYGQALLDRLGSLDGLAALANEESLAILQALVPTSQKKLAQRLVREAEDKASAQLDEDLLARLLQRKAHFLEMRARSAGEIAGEAEMKKAELLPALASLIAAGFVVRGASVRCPQCQIGVTLLLDEQSEKIRCRACGNSYLLPMLEEGGKAEPPVVYQLDGLMARAMDQDLLPVLLTLRACLPGDASAVRATWLGLEFSRKDGGKKVECDLLISDGSTVTVAECKATASISDSQLDSLLEFAARHDARPVLGALSGNFADKQREAVLGQGGRVLERDDLLAGTA